MTQEERPRRESGLFMEFALAAVILVALTDIVVFFLNAGYLKPPFFHDIDDTFMDWYNTAYWANNKGAYEDWLSVYPPISFDFMRIFSISSCYDAGPMGARSCDPIGRYFVSALLLLNAVLIYFTYRKAGRRSALARTVALGLGMPMLYAWERGNLILPCLTLLILGHGRLLKSAWLKWIAVGATINFKPYLVVTVLGDLVNRRWRRLEGYAIAAVAVYIVSYAWEADGDPFQLVRNIGWFTYHTISMSLDTSLYSTSYSSVMELARTSFPLMYFVGSRPIELLEAIAPALIRTGELGVLACFLGAAWRPGALSHYRLAGLTMTLFMSVTNPGGYSEVFLLFFVFFEPWRGVGRILALVAGYLLCVPWDFTIVRIAHEIRDSYLSSRSVGYDLAVTGGALIRPGLILLIEYAMIATSFADIWRASGWRLERRPSARGNAFTAGAADGAA